MTQQWNATVNPRVCVRTGLCVATAPDEFDVDDDGRGRPSADTQPASPTLLDAAESCPVEAITLIDSATGERVFPS